MIHLLLKWRGNAEIECAYYQYDNRPHDFKWHLLKYKFKLSNYLIKLINNNPS